MIVDECEAVIGMPLSKENRSTMKKPAPMSLCSAQIQHDLTWARTRTAAMGRWGNLHSGGWSPAGSTRHGGHWLVSCTCPGWLWWRIWWNKDWQGKPKYSEKTRQAALCPPQISLDQTRDRTWATAVGSQRLAAWATARPRWGMAPPNR
jgi:hypothetical protein